MKISFLILISIVFYSCGNEHSKNISSTFHKDTSQNIFTDTVFKFEAKYNFSSFKVDLYTKKLAPPNFKNNPFATDKEYVDFIVEGCNKKGINFGGHYTIIQKGCGTECELIFIVDRISGKIFIGTKPNDGRYGFLYRKDSNLLIANSNSFQDESLKTYTKFFGVPELYLWTENDFKRVQ